MAWLRVQNLTLTAGDRTLVEEATFRLDPGDRVAIVGPNGMGKTTLFRTLAGKRMPADGTIETGGDLHLSVLDQLHDLPEEGTVYGLAQTAHPRLAALTREKETLEAKMADPAVSDLDAVLARYGAVLEAFEEAHGYDWEARVRQALLGAGLGESRFSDRVKTLSGGERHRLALVRVVLSGANVWLLDEPTNHLDLDAMLWLENTLLAFPGAVLMSSHDRRFLDRAATRVMSWEDGFFWMVTGTYRRYLTLREERLRDQARAWQRYEEERARLAAYVDRYRAGNRATQAKSRLHQLEHLTREAPVTTAPKPRPRPSLAHQGREIAGQAALTVKDLVLRRGDREWPPVSFKVPGTGRLAISGPNGTGKTTLLHALVARLPGVSWHPEAELTYYDQEAASLLPEDVSGLALANREGMERETIYHLGARFGLTPELLAEPLGHWSGGERARLALLFALMAPSSVLLLDEPTNHLDIAMRRELENLLTAYPGAILLVSHDRELMDTVGTHLLWWQDGGFHFRPGRYSDILGT